MSSPPILSDMPDDILEQIFDECGFRDIQSLRKTCHTLRNFIDDTQPDPKLTEIEMVINPEDTVVYYHKDEKTYRIIYENHENGCKIYWKNREKLVQGVENGALPFQDLALILKGQGSNLRKLRLIWTFPEPENLQNHFKVLETTLKSRKTLLKVQKLHLEPSSSSQILQIFPFLEPGALRKIEIYSTFFDDFSNEVVELEQWKRAREAFVYDCLKFKSMSDFSNFNEAMACLEQFSLNEMVELKETFFHHPDFKSFHFYFKNLTDWEKFTNFAGEPAVSDEFEKIWYFRVLDSEWILKVVKDNKENLVEFKRIERASLVENVLDIDTVNSVIERPL